MSNDGSSATVPISLNCALLIDRDLVRLQKVKKALDPIPAIIASSLEDVNHQVKLGEFNIVLIWPLIDDVQKIIEALKTASIESPWLKIAYVAELSDVPKMILEGRREWPVISLGASPRRLKSSIERFTGSVPAEMTVGIPADDGQALILSTVRRAARLQGSTIRQSGSSSLKSVQVVLPQGQELTDLQATLVYEWGHPLRPGQSEQHPVVQLLNGLTEGQMVYVKSLTPDQRKWAYAAFLPWKEAPKTTMVAGTASVSSENTRGELVSLAQDLAFTEASRINIPAINLTQGAAVVVPEYDWIATPDYVGPDRRKNPTPFFSRYTLIGRRRVLLKGISRSEGFIDRNGRWLLKYFAAYLLLSSIDTALTYKFVRNGRVTELNPLLRALVYDYPIAFFVVKNAIAITGFGLVARFEKFSFGLALVLALLGTYLALDIYWLVLLTH